MLEVLRHLVPWQYRILGYLDSKQGSTSMFQNIFCLKTWDFQTEKPGRFLKSDAEWHSQKINLVVSSLGNYPQNPFALESKCISLCHL